MAGISEIGNARPNPETGYRQELVKVGAKGSKWQDKAEPKREDLPGGGVLHKGFRKHIDELKGNIPHLEEALQENGGENKRLITGELIKSDPKRQKAVKESAEASESLRQEGRSVPRRTVSAKPDAVKKANARSAAPADGGSLFNSVMATGSSLASHLSGVDRASAVSRGIGHVWDTATGYMHAANRALATAKQHRDNRAGLRSLPHLANAALMLHHAFTSLKGSGLEHPTIDTDTTRKLAEATQKHAAANGRGDVI